MITAVKPVEIDRIRIDHRDKYHDFVRNVLTFIPDKPYTRRRNYSDQEIKNHLEK